MSKAETTSPGTKSGIRHIRARNRVDEWRNNSIANLQQGCVNMERKELRAAFQNLRAALISAACQLEVIDKLLTIE